jgi:glycerol-3-phosphate dehydrogenase
MNRDEMIGRIEDAGRRWDILVIGGGATGVSIALDAATRGYGTVLLEQSDFGKGSSSRSTKLIHGGVRYLQQGNISLVMEALRERGILRRNAPHLVRDLAFVVPNYDWWEAPFYGIGLKVYDLLAGKYGFGESRLLSQEETVARIPTIRTDGLRGGVLYHDAQFDDCRLLVHLARTAATHGATLLNYAGVVALLKDPAGYVCGAVCRDAETGREYKLHSRSVINATGAFTDGVRRLSDPDDPPLIAPSQGIHVVLDRSLLPGDSAIMVPRTGDGRVMFAIPWRGTTLVGTTDTPVDAAMLEPVPLREELEFLLETAGQYLSKQPSRQDVRSVFAGIRPLVGSPGSSGTASISRDHTIHISRSGLLTIAGGKWTTCRHMAEDCVNHASVLAGLDPRPCVTATLPVYGFDEDAGRHGELALYGSDAAEIRSLANREPSLAAPIHPRLPYLGAEVAWAARFEMARTVEDVLSRRTRALLVDARAALAAAPAVAALLAQALGRNRRWVEEQLAGFAHVASTYTLEGLEESWGARVL